MSDKYRRLYELSKNRLLSVAYMFTLGWGEMRDLEVEAEIVCVGGDVKGVLCFLLLHNVVLHVDDVD